MRGDKHGVRGQPGKLWAEEVGQPEWPQVIRETGSVTHLNRDSGRAVHHSSDVHFLNPTDFTEACYEPTEMLSARFGCLDVPRDTKRVRVDFSKVSCVSHQKQRTANCWDDFHPTL